MELCALVILALSVPNQVTGQRQDDARVPQSEEEVAVLSLEVPRFVTRGQDAELLCQWRVPRLYSLKWYYNDNEVFAYKPSEVPSLALHPLPGVSVDPHRSTGERLVLREVELEASGRYKCEVIGETPGFLTDDRSGYLTVVQIPEAKPQIFGTRPQYKVGETAHVSCVSPPSRPPALLTWFINDRKAPAEYVTGLNSSRVRPGGLVESRAGLNFVLAPSHFPGGQLRLRCAATIPGLYHKTRQHSVGPPVPTPRPTHAHDPLNTAHKAPVMESRDSAALDGGCGVSRLPSELLIVLTLLLSLSLSS